ncbi:MAG: hypothetical protein JXR25_00325 [Pontiellaceae bacterium]|nr:hypothetical protein [Pontiellaceae bacterium]MBN2783244.1 hypothetical protein [Pontiellaceae bacterium]
MSVAKGQKAKDAPADLRYEEVSLKLPLIILVLSLVLTGGPLAWGLVKVNEDGEASIGVSKYLTLADGAAKNIALVKNALQGRKEESQQVKDVVTLVVPEVVIVEAEKTEVKGPKPLDVEIHGIYFSRNMPLVDLDGQTYRVGDSVQGYRITKISETSVHFIGPDNKAVVRDMYEDLFVKGN